MDLRLLQLRLAEKLIQGLNASPEVEVNPLVEALELDEESEEELWDALHGGGEVLIRFERFFGASPMTDTTAGAIEILDLGVEPLFLVSPGDMSVDLPMTVFATVPRDDRTLAFELAGDVIVRSLREQSLPAGGSLDDRLYVARDFPDAVLRDAYRRAIDEGSVNMADLEEVLRSLNAWPAESEQAAGPARSRVLADAYVGAALRRVGGDAQAE